MNDVHVRVLQSALCQAAATESAGKRCKLPCELHLRAARVLVSALRQRGYTLASLTEGVGVRVSGAQPAVSAEGVTP